MTRKLPIGIQSFEGLRKDGYLYVDKTALVYKLVSEGKPYFLSRPRRFGKSLLVTTLQAYFEGKRELFDGLAIQQLEDESPNAWQARPVFMLSFNGADYTQAGGLEDKLDAILSGLEKAWGCERSSLLPGPRFQRLLGYAHVQAGHRCVVLIDEYDKPMLEAIHDLALEERNRAILKGLFSVLKDADEHLRFVFITGVTKFSKVSIFSDLNQMNDISMDRSFATICGITEKEMLSTFGPEIDRMASELEVSQLECVAQLKAQYNGYRFHPSTPGLYNPFSLLKALYAREFGSYWFETGTPTFLVQRMRAAELDPRRLTDGSIYATQRRLSDYRADDPDPVPLLFQTGYLTISDYDKRSGRYSLAVPNSEVEWGLLENLLPTWTPGYSEARGTDVFTLWDYVETGNTDAIRRVLAALFASIPYTQADDPFENYFQAVIWLTFTLLGRYVHVEVHQAQGRVDCIVEARSHVYLFEFKRDDTTQAALAQIDERDYAAPFAADSREMHTIGCTFDSTTRLMSGWEER